MAKGSVSPVSDNDADDWKKESDHRTLTEAAQIKGDSKRMAGVKKFHEKKMSAMKSVGRSLGRTR